MLTVYFYRDPTLFNNEEKTARIGLLKYVLVLFACEYNHLLNHFSTLIAGKTREEKVGSDNVCYFALIFR